MSEIASAYYRVEWLLWLDRLVCTLYTHSGDSANVVFARDGFVVGGVWVVAWGLGFGVAKQRVAKQLPTFVKTYSIHNDRASRLVDKIRPPVHTHTHTHTRPPSFSIVPLNSCPENERKQSLSLQLHRWWPPSLDTTYEKGEEKTRAKYRTLSALVLSPSSYSVTRPLSQPSHSTAVVLSADSAHPSLLHTQS